MRVSHLSTLTAKVFYLLLLFCFSCQIGAQPSPTNTTDFSCSVNSTPCDTHVAYFAQSPRYLDLGNISDLFGVSPLSIAKGSNLVSEKALLFPGQLLLVPIKCGCSGGNYSANMTYRMKQGDNYYVVSITAFENLTNWQAVEAMNPSLNATLLPIGVEVIFPLFCKCPSRAQLQNGINYLITYVWQHSDDVPGVAAKLNASANHIVTENNNRNFSNAWTYPVLIPVSQLPVLSRSYPSPPGHAPRHHWIAWIVVSVFSLAAFLACGSFLQKKRKLLTLNRCDSSFDTVDLIQEKEYENSEHFEPKFIQDKLLRGVSGYLDKPIMYDIDVIMGATMNLNEHYRIGKSVFRANIDGKALAIKKIKDDVREELKLLQKVNHANLVKLMGISFESEENRFLVYEYAENGSLDKWLYPNPSSFSSSATFLPWNQRLQIALDVASGLQYLHEHTQPSTVHWDLRASNILLDTRFKAKIANFSLAAPATHPTTPKVDVLAFGIVLLELLSGKKAARTNEMGEIIMLWKTIRAELEVEDEREENLRKWMDPKLEDYYSIDDALSLAGLAKACTQENSSARPCMAEVVFNLSVLAQGSCESFERSWTGLEVGEVNHMINPVIAR